MTRRDTDLHRLPGAIDYALRHAPLTDSDRALLRTAQDSLGDLSDQVVDILDRYNMATLLQRPDTSFLREPGLSKPLNPRPPIIKCTLGQDDNGDSLELDLTRTTHGIIVGGNNSHNDENPEPQHGHDLTHALVRSAAGHSRDQLLIWLVRPLPITSQHTAATRRYLNRTEELRTLPNVTDVFLGDPQPLAMQLDTQIREEFIRREKLLATAGQRDITSYTQHRDNHPDLAPLPRLLIQIDNFSDLLDDRALERTVYLAITKGISLGIHIQLCADEISPLATSAATPSLQIQSHLTYRIVMNSTRHTQRTVLGAASTDEIAADLQHPGIGYLCIQLHGARRLTRFHCPPPTHVTSEEKLS